MDVFLELSLIVGITVLIAGIMRLLRQPLIVGYLLSGIIVSPYFLNLVRSTDTIAIFSQIGVAFLLFIIGLSLSPKVIKEVGKVSLVTGLGQIIFTSLIGFFICKLLGFSTIVSLYIAIALTFCVGTLGSLFLGVCCIPMIFSIKINPDKSSVYLFISTYITAYKNRDISKLKSLFTNKAKENGESINNVFDLYKENFDSFNIIAYDIKFEKVDLTANNASVNGGFIITYKSMKVFILKCSLSVFN